ncbi:hypothetical protein AB0D73_09590 [Streptomyces sp. NPDC048215]|uniref:hypothetical protein n=1 Tax=Streptomyces sp. NPDC048215 TaxID=3156690 RepID=UPI0033CDB06E
MSESAGNAILVNVLTSSLRSTLNGMETTPGLLRQVLEEGSWRTFTTPRGETVTHETFEEFVTTAPTKGLGRTIEEIVQAVFDDESALDLLAAELDVTVEDLRNSEQLRSVADPIAQDAETFGSYARAGGWMFGLIVARSVVIESRNRSHDGSHKDALATHRIETPESSRKVSAKQFALRSGTTATRVTRFFRAWERASGDGLVPCARELRPGQVVDLPDSELWGQYFTTYEKSTERRESIAQQAEIAGTSYSQAVKVAENPAALRTAILGDGKTAEAARKALLDRMEEDDDLRVTLARSVARDPQMKKHLSSEVRKNERSEFIRHIAEQGKAKTPAGQTVELSSEIKSRVSDQWASIDTSDSDADAISSAYEAVRELITEAVESDPGTQEVEQRSKLTKALNSTAKSIQSIDPEVLADLADDSVRETVIELQRTVNELAELLRVTNSVNLRAV